MALCNSAETWLDKVGKMLPLEMLAAVASETLKNEIADQSIEDNTVRSQSNSKIKPALNRKCLANHERLTLNQIKALSHKALMEKFSELTSDELRKKYSYKCFLMPEKCSTTFKSFGNEKKAYHQMKMHLLSHLTQLSTESFATEDDKSIVFTAKPLVFRKKNLSGKNLKKKINSSKKKQSSNWNKAILKGKNFKNANKSILKKIKNNIKPYFFNKFSTNKLKKHCMLTYSNDMLYTNNLDKDKIKNEENLDSSNNEHSCVHMCACKSCTVTSLNNNNDYHSDYNDDEDFCDCSISEDPPIKSNSEMKLSDIIYHDHNYTTSEGSKYAGIIEPTKFKKVNININAIKHQMIEPQFIIKTPPFPYVYIPLLPEVALIKELKYASSDCKNITYSSHAFDGPCTSCENYDESFIKKECSVANSVLECVENKVSLKEPFDCIKKNANFSEDPDENCEENIQMVEKELALELIGNLRSKKKNQSLKCKICKDKNFTAQATLIHHYRSHAGIKPYICNICYATFTRQHSLNYHILIHKNISRFLCDHCGRAFRHPSHYKEHLRRHTGETPYHCTDCTLHFKTRNTFKRHLKTRHGKLLTAKGIQDMATEEYMDL